MKRKEHWNLSKVGKLAVCQFFAVSSCLVVVLYNSPLSETLVHVNGERLLIYSILLGFSFLLTGEVVGLFANHHRNLVWKKLFLSFFSAAIGSLGLILVVWTIEFDFIGRLAIFKMVGLTGLSVFLFLVFLIGLNRGNPWRVLPLLSEGRLGEIKKSQKLTHDKIEWLPFNFNVHSGCIVELSKKEAIDLVLVDSEHQELDVMALLSSGVRVMGVSAFWETFAQKIPHSEINKSWLTKLDLRQRDPVVRRVKRLLDMLVSSIGLILLSPLLVCSCLAIALESGFPVFFKQKRSGYLGRPYNLYKLRTMTPNAEKDGAQWATQGDERVTLVGRFLRRLRIDEIPQFWNVIKGEMSVVGPRPERPELEEEIVKKLPYWNCRYLLKPGITGWAQIKYRYASDIESSDEKLSYDLFYVKNSSFFLDLEIILSTLRSLMKGSR